MDVSPIPSTPLSGVSVTSKWNCDSSVILTPGSLDLRRKLFDLSADDEREGESLNEGTTEQQKQWSPSSGYFSRSVNEDSESSGSSQTNSFTEEGSPSSNQVCS